MYAQEGNDTRGIEHGATSGLSCQGEACPRKAGSDVITDRCCLNGERYSV